jgi:hypothetical protein
MLLGAVYRVWKYMRIRTRSARDREELGVKHLASDMPVLPELAGFSTG